MQLATIVVPFALAGPAGDGGATLCTSKDYRILTPSVLAIRCAEPDVSQVKARAGELFLLGTSAIEQVTRNVKVVPFTSVRQWLLVSLEGNNGAYELTPKHKYRLLLHLTSPTVADATTTTDVDSTEVMTIGSLLFGNDPRRYQATSHLALIARGFPEHCNLRLKNFSGQSRTIGADCTIIAPLPDPPTIERLQEVDPDGIGVLNLHLDQTVREYQQIPDAVPGLLGVFRHELIIDPKSRLLTSQAPAAKDAAYLYVKLSHAAGVGTTPSWTLDGKLAPPVGTLHAGFQFVPQATADVGQGTVGGTTYSNTVRFAGTLQKVIEPNRYLQEVLFVPGIAFETDKELDRDNLLGTIDARLQFAHLYSPRAMQALARYERERKVAQDHGIDLQPNDVKPPLLGYALDAHLGSETGGPLRDTITKASKGTATLNTPTYTIARFVPQLHGLLEVGRVSIDLTGTPRYLATTEFTVRELPDHSLILKPIKGWQALGQTTVTCTLDPAGHFAIDVTYKNGFSPPKYTRVNAVQSGLLIKF